MTELSRERREEIKLECESRKNWVVLPPCDILALLRDSERLEQLEELDITGSDVRGDKLDPRALTAADEDRIVAKTLRVWAGIAQGFNAGRYDAATLEDALYLMADDMEGGE